MEKLPTIDIKGKEYVMVKDRILWFAENDPSGSITTEIIKNDANSVVVKATIASRYIPAGGDPTIWRTFTGHSEAYRKGNMGDVPVEVAETSAVGRALAMMGIGIIDSVASADEVRKSEDRPSYIKKAAKLDDVPVIQEGDPFNTLGVVCKHGLPAKRLEVKKEGPNKGKGFYACPKPKAEQCDFFEWANDPVVDIDAPLNIEGEKSDYDPETGELLPF